MRWKFEKCTTTFTSLSKSRCVLGISLKISESKDANMNLNHSVAYKLRQILFSSVQQFFSRVEKIFNFSIDDHVRYKTFKMVKFSEIGPANKVGRERKPSA